MQTSAQQILKSATPSAASNALWAQERHCPLDPPLGTLGGQDKNRGQIFGGPCAPDAHEYSCAPAPNQHQNNFG